MEYNTKNLTPIQDAYNRTAQAIDEHEWEGDFDRADFLRQELKHIEELRDKGDVYVPNF
jgi:hypothetical protein